MASTESSHAPAVGGGLGVGGGKSNPQQKPQGCDVKPRLTKEQHDILEQHFQQQHKPTTIVKKDFAEKLQVPLDKINVRISQPFLAWP